MEASRFLATTLWMWTEQNVTVEGRRKSPRTNEYNHAPTCPYWLKLPERRGPQGGLRSVPVEQDGEVRITSYAMNWSETHVITGFLKDDRVKTATCRRNDLCGVPTLGLGSTAAQRDGTGDA